MEQDNIICAGMDIGDRYCHIVVLDEQGQVAERSRIRTTPSAVRRYLRGRPTMRVAMEVGTHSPWLSSEASVAGHEVLVGNAARLRLITANDRKSDQVDAELLARIARFDPQLLYPIIHKDQHSRAAWSVLRTRDALVRARVLLINHARGLAKPAGYRLPRCSSAHFGQLCEQVPEVLAPALLPVLASVAHLSQQIKTYDRQITKICQEQYPQTELLRQVPGVGPITALAFVLVIQDPGRFCQRRNVGAYLGLVPRRSQSGQHDPELPISKAGDSYLRRLLVQCAHYILGHFGPDCDLRRYGQRIIDHGGTHAKKRARTAVARKLAVLLLTMWQNGTDYQPRRGTLRDDGAAA